MSFIRRSVLIKLTAAILFTLAGSSAFAEAIAPIFSTKAGAIRGYDPVAYITQNKPVKGKANLSYTWQGATWHFSTQANLDAFKEEPEKYAPQYGGYCAFGVAQGYTPETDPYAYKVIDGKLYLNLSKLVLKRWEEDIPGYIKTADQHWPELKAGTYVEK
ncbi:YHS domain-containing (seleno)protein [Undibacterium sp. RuRC25W]|uniref:YHS domain-containing (seleno)protein n=1 Tax=Undibacterium sp. RuRC25W TaxID=3413047 RepID=UPI003BEF9884